MRSWHMTGWEEYYERVGNTPNSIVVDVVRQYVTSRGAALDLGAGNLRDSKYLLQSGFERVVAVDVSPESFDYVVPEIDLKIMPVELYRAPHDTFDLCISCNTLFFVAMDDIYHTFDSLRTMLL